MQYDTSGVILSSLDVFLLCRLNTTYRQLFRDNETLTLDHKSTKSQLNSSKLEHGRLEAEFSRLREQHQQLDISSTKLTNQCEVRPLTPHLLLLFSPLLLSFPPSLLVLHILHVLSSPILSSFLPSPLLPHQTLLLNVLATGFFYLWLSLSKVAVVLPVVFWVPPCPETFPVNANFWESGPLVCGL